MIKLEQKEINFVTTMVEQYQNSICPTVIAQQFKDVISLWDRDKQNIVYACLRGLTPESSAFYLEIMRISASYDKDGSLISFKIED